MQIHSFLIFKFYLVKPRPNLDLFRLPSTAAALHSEMYTAFAGGDLSPVAHKVCEGLLQSLKMRVSQRKPNSYLHWEVKKQLSRPKLCSFKAVALPGRKDEPKDERNTQVQAVVRLHTLQGLRHVQRVAKRVGKSLETHEEMGPEESKESIEYIVLQQSLRKGRGSGQWQVWGFTNETSLAKVQKEAGEKAENKAKKDEK